MTTTGHRISLCSDENVLKLDSDNGYTTLTINH